MAKECLVPQKKIVLKKTRRTNCCKTALDGAAFIHCINKKTQRLFRRHLCSKTKDGLTLTPSLEIAKKLKTKIHAAVNITH